MSFDGVFTHSMVNELKDALQSGRINKVHQPYPQEVVLVIRSRGKNQRLLLSAHSSYARIQITEIDYQNPTSPPNFCMMLRKYLEGALLEDIKQIENDRVIHFSFTKRDELGDLQNIVLIVELMGRHSTIVLVNQATGKIIDCIKHIGPSQNSYRLLLPGAEYFPPPPQTALNPWTASTETVFHRINTAPDLTGNYLQTQFQGLGKDSSDELAAGFKLMPNAKMQVWQSFWEQIDKKPQPTLTTYREKDYFTALPYETLGTQRQNFPTLSQLLDAFYAGKAEKERVKQMGTELLRKISNDLQKNRQKTGKLEATLAASENAEEIRRNGELLTTFLNQVPKGAQSVTLPNYYEEDSPVEIGLNPALSPNQNAQKYFQKYQKLKNGVHIVEAQIAETKKEIAYLESVESQLELATPLDLEIIREELLAEGYLRAPKKKAGRKMAPSQPEKFTSTTGISILVGKNNLQNDQLTLRKAKKTDIWLHAKDIPGSHVIIESDQPDETTLLEAAQLAAYFSKFRASANVPVDYVPVKFIHKPNGAKPGYVIYEKQHTLYVTPNEEIVKALKKSEK